MLFQGSSQLAGLPPYLTVQMMRFYYKADVRQKAKILRKVGGGVRGYLAPRACVGLSRHTERCRRAATHTLRPV